MRLTASFPALAVCALLSGGIVAAADEQPASPASETASPVVARPGAAQPNVTEPAAPARRKRAISADVAAQLSAAMPKFTPPPPAPPPSEAAPAQTEEIDARDIDKPRNGIIRLPKYVVREPPPPIFKEREIYTKKGLAGLAMSRYMTEADRALNGFTLPLFGTPAEARAMSMYEEDERLKNMAAMREQTRLMYLTDPATANAVKKQADSTFARPGNFEWRPMGR